MQRKIRNGYGRLDEEILLWRFAKATKNIVSFNDALEFAFSSKFHPLLEPIQIRNEIQKLCQIVAQRNPKTILEIGSHHGGTLFLFSRIAVPDALLVSVNLTNEDLKRWRRLCECLQMKGQQIRLIDGDSHANSTMERVRSVLGSRKVDLLFIDGDHSYEGVRQDFEDYTPLVNVSGIIALHDINPDNRTRYGSVTPNNSGDVHRFWTEVKKKYRHIQCVDDPNQDGYGIGILFLAENSGNA